MPYNKSFIDQASSVKMAGYWPSSLFALLWTETKHWKGNQLDAKVVARAPISWLDKFKKYNHLIGYIFEE